MSTTSIAVLQNCFLILQAKISLRKPKPSKLCFFNYALQNLFAKSLFVVLKNVDAYLEKGDLSKLILKNSRFSQILNNFYN